MVDNRKAKNTNIKLTSKVYNEQVKQHTAIIKKIKTKVNRRYGTIRQPNGKSESTCGQNHFHYL